MALPALPAGPRRSRALEKQIVRQREQEARWRQQWERNSRYFQQSGLCSAQHGQWSSRRCYQRSMNAYHGETMKEGKKISLEQRREQLRKLLYQERELLAAELGELRLNKESDLSKIRERSGDLKSAKEERRKKVAEELLYEHWKKNNTKLREIESELHKKHVIDVWGDQLTEKKQREATEREEKRRYENEYEIARREALERLKQEEERRQLEEKKRAEVLLQQMEELKFREMQATKLKKEQEHLLKQQWELEELEEERKQMEACRKKLELGRFLRHQYNAQLKRRAQQIQQELEMDRQILLALLEKEDADQRLQSARRERAAADAAWMKHVIEEQLQLEKAREAELETIFREEAKQVWEKREEEWERERKVLAGRLCQIQEKVELNRHAQEECVKYREQLIRELEEAKELTRREREEEEELKTARKQELESQLTERHLQEQEELQHQKEEEEAARLAEQHCEELVRQEAKRMTERGYHSKPYGRPKTAWI
ncbi:trichoplein keratin filament-binding protein isoform X2 [Dermochelys coriacea]|uniref:trichoplein keratin filament-binding protein isoform X2 n=1 Tax=Dermochelys coriacea TaxID=27794 RepID=UPI001CA92B13|nr:trichoplein keratin filament-binding protein isoform X2 [Dermochelys coriacea]